MSSTNDRRPDGLFEDDEFLRKLGLGDLSADPPASAPLPPAAPPPAAVPEPPPAGDGKPRRWEATAARPAAADPEPTPAAEPAAPPDKPSGGGGGWGVIGTGGSILGFLVLVVVVRGVKQGINVAVNNTSAPTPPAAAPRFTPQEEEELARLFDPNRRRTADPPAAPGWTPPPLGTSPLDKFDPARDVPARLRHPGTPRELVALVEPDPARTWADDLGPNAAPHRGKLLDHRRLANGTTRLLAADDDGAVESLDLAADGTPTPLGELGGTAVAARLGLAGDVTLLTDGRTVRRVNPTEDGAAGTVLEALSGPPADYVQMELLDRDRLLVLRQSDGRLRETKLLGYRAVAPVDLGPEAAADDIAASPDRTLLAAVSKARKELTLTEYTASGPRTRTMRLPVAPVRAAVHPGKRLVAVLDDRNGAFVMDLETAKSVLSFTASRPPRVLEFAADGRHLLNHDPSGRISVLRLPTDPPAPSRSRPTGRGS